MAEIRRESHRLILVSDASWVNALLMKHWGVGPLGFLLVVVIAMWLRGLADLWIVAVVSVLLVASRWIVRRLIGTNLPRTTVFDLSRNEVRLNDHPVLAIDELVRAEAYVRMSKPNMPSWPATLSLYGTSGKVVRLGYFLENAAEPAVAAIAALLGWPAPATRRNDRFHIRIGAGRTAAAPE